MALLSGKVPPTAYLDEYLLGITDAARDNWKALAAQVTGALQGASTGQMTKQDQSDVVLISQLFLSDTGDVSPLYHDADAFFSLPLRQSLCHLEDLGYTAASVAELRCRVNELWYHLNDSFLADHAPRDTSVSSVLLYSWFDESLLYGLSDSQLVLLAQELANALSSSGIVFESVPEPATLHAMLTSTLDAIRCT